MAFDSRSDDTENQNRRTVKLVLGKSEDFEDVRCEGCGALLYRELRKSKVDGREIEIKCRRCGAVHRN